MIALSLIGVMALVFYFHCALLALVVETGPKPARKSALKLLSDLESPDALEALLYLGSREDLEEAQDAETMAYEMAKERLDPRLSFEIYLLSLDGISTTEMRSRLSYFCSLLSVYRRRKSLPENLSSVVRRTLPIWKAAFKKRISETKGTPRLIAIYRFNVMLLAVACSDLKGRGVNVDFIARDRNGNEFSYFNFHRCSVLERRQLSDELERGSDELIRIVNDLEDDPVLLPVILGMPLCLMGRRGLALLRDHYASADFVMKQSLLWGLQNRIRLHGLESRPCRPPCEICSLYKYSLSVKVGSELIKTLSYMAYDFRIENSLSSWVAESLQQSEGGVSQLVQVYSLHLWDLPGRVWLKFLNRRSAKQRAKILIAMLTVLERRNIKSYNQALVKFEMEFEPEAIRPLLKHEDGELRIYGAIWGLTRLGGTDEIEAAEFIGDCVVASLSVFLKGANDDRGDVSEFLYELLESRKGSKNKASMAKAVLEKISKAELYWPAAQSIESTLACKMFVALLGLDLLKAIKKEAGNEQPELIKLINEAELWLERN